MREHEATMLQKWITAFERSGGCVIRQIEKKKEIFDLLKKWHLAFDNCHNKFQNTQFPEATSVFLVSLFGDSRLPTHRRSSLTFAMELRPSDGWIPDVQGIPGEFVLFDSELQWTIIVTHEGTETLFS